jgi:hypothetical protein
VPVVQTLIACAPESRERDARRRGNSVSTTFNFPGPAIPAGSLVTFSMTMISGPENAFVFYNRALPDDSSCPITDTNDTSPPLSTFRRQGIVATVVRGTRPPVIE